MQLGERTLLMGVLNVTPDSFSDGGRFNDPDRAYARALELEEHGADIIDIGAESTRPGSKRITADEEWQRLVPILKRLRGNLRVPLSLDTYKAEIAERAVQYGVEIINDPSGLTFDPALAKAAASGNAGLILNHMRGQPETWAKLPPMQDPMGTIARELEATASRARHAGVDRARIIVDPGIGFGKRKEQNAEILAKLDALAKLDYPILVGPSRKSFLAQASESGTLFGTAAAVAAAVLGGAHIVRVHDVKEMQAVVLVAEEIARAAAPTVAPGADDKIVVRARTRTGPNFEAEKPRPPRPPVSKPRVAEPVIEPLAEPIAQPSGEEIAIPLAEEAVRPAAASEVPAPTPPVRGTFIPRVNDREARPPRGRYPDSEKRDGSRPPTRPATRPFSPRRSEERSGPPPRGRDFRPGQGAKRPFDRDRPPGRNDERPPRRDDGERPPRRNDREEYRPAARSGPRSAPPRSGPPRSGPPRSGPPRARRDDDRPRPSGFKPAGFKPGGPKRSFDRGGDTRGERPPRRPEGGGGPKSGPPRGGRPDGGTERPPKRPFRKRP